MSTQVKTISGNEFIENWKAKYFAPRPHDTEWARLKWHVCRPGEPVNPISYAKGGEIQVEQFGIIGWLYRVKDQTFPFAKPEKYFYQCPLIEARETGTGKFGQWLQNVQLFVWEKYQAPFALCTITNEHLYKYCEVYKVPVAHEYRLYSVTTKK